MEQQIESHKKDKKIASSSSKRGSRRRRRRIEKVLQISWRKKIRYDDDDVDVRGREVIEKLNEDVLEEIMLRLPVKSLIRFQNVSKDWKLAITSSSFREKYRLYHKSQDPKILCLYDHIDLVLYRPYSYKTSLKTMSLDWSTTRLVEEEEEYYTSDQSLAKLKLLCGSLDGVFCFYITTEWTRQIKVINPATRWSYTLPLATIELGDCYICCFLPGFGKDYVTGTYKVVSLYQLDKTSLSCEVFDFGVKQWRQVIPPPGHHLIEVWHSPTFANGWLYWFSDEKTNIIAFDLHMETFRVFPTPINVVPSPLFSSTCVDMVMGSIDDDRGLVWISLTNKDGIQQNWRLTNHNTGGVLLKMDKMFSFDLIKITSTTFNPHVSLLFKLVAISKNGNKVMLHKDKNNVILFQPLNSNSRIFTYPPSRTTSASLFSSYFPSFVSL